MGFLDGAGLAHLWGKVKAALAQKADAAAVLDKATYDPTGKARDVFAYADAAAEARGVFYLTGTFSEDGNAVTLDRTWEEFEAAYGTGKECIVAITAIEGGVPIANVLYTLVNYAIGQMAEFTFVYGEISSYLLFSPQGVELLDINLALKPKTTTITLTAAGWANNSQSVTAQGTWPSQNVTTVSPAPESYDAYGAAGVRCTAQNGGTFTFVCTKTPTVDLTVNIVCQEV